MNKLEPIDLLKRELAIFEKAINKCTVSNYRRVSGSLNPWIEKYKYVISLLESAPAKSAEEILCRKRLLIKDGVEWVPYNSALEAMEEYARQSQVSDDTKSLLKDVIGWEKDYASLESILRDKYHINKKSKPQNKER